MGGRHAKKSKMSSYRYNGYANGNGNNGHGFNLATVVQIGLIPLITVVIGLAGFYYITKDELGRHEIAITTTLPQELKEEKDAREKTRTEFMDRFIKLTDVISALNTNVAVMAEQNKQIAASIAKLDSKL